MEEKHIFKDPVYKQLYDTWLSKNDAVYKRLAQYAVECDGGKPVVKKILETKTIDGIPYIRGKCSCCKKCWVDLKTGRCLAGGPFDGYTKDKDIEAPEAIEKPIAEAGTLPLVSDGGERPPWE